MCHNLAAQGFNICIVSRNEDKMKQKLEEIKKSAKDNINFKSMYIVADFTKMMTLDDYRTTIANKLSDIDVSMLILNAGMAATGPFDRIDEVNVSNILHCNIMQKSYLPKLMAK